jgi:uncharacterized SAM-binding protein YcdF (DUF218 family)/lysophospholipase L1-like esterase
MTTRSGRWFRIPVRSRGFAGGLLTALVLVYVARVVINKTSVADSLVAPMLLSDTAGTADAIVIMGAGVVGDCAPNQTGVWRVIYGVRMWRERRAPVVVFTGGSGKPCPVAMAMANFAREIGLPDASIQLETTSQTTKENAERSAPILQRLNARRVLVVTDKLHMRRSAGVFTTLGFTVQRMSVPMYLGHEDNVAILFAAARETAALTYYRMRGWTGRTPPAGNESLSPADTTDLAGRTMPVEAGNPTGPVVVLGASYAEGWTPQSVSGLPVVNRGVSGQQSFEMLERFERDVVAARPRAVIIWGFINDIFRTSPQGAEAALTRMRDSYARMIESCRSHGIEPVLATEVTLRPQEGWTDTVRLWIARLRGKEPYQERINRYVHAGNQWLLDAAREKKILVLDFQAALGDGHGRRRREFIADDGSHITPAGYAALTAYAAPILERHFETQAGSGS